MKKLTKFTVFFVLIFSLSKSNAFDRIINSPGQRTILGSNIYDNITIYPGSYVDMFGVIKMNPNKTIRIMAGAVVRLQGLITTVDDWNDDQHNNTDRFWNGIILEGNPNYDQVEERNFICQKLSCFDIPDDNDFETFVSGITLHQGILHMVNTEMKFSQNGIFVGGQHLNPANVSGSGGLLFAKSCSFTNNLNNAISFASYSLTKQQLSIVQENYFTTDFKNSTLKPNGLTFFLHSWFNKFYFDISKNNFRQLPSTSNPNDKSRGIYFVYCESHINNNTFSDLEVGIIHSSILPDPKNTVNIDENKFIRCYSSCQIISGDLINVRENIFSLPDYDMNRGTLAYDFATQTYNQNAIYIEAGRISQIIGNKIDKANSNNRSEIGIITSDNSGGTFNWPIAIYDNQIINQQYAYQAQYNSKGVQTSCNEFVRNMALGTTRDMIVASNPGLSAQGSSALSAGNCFSNISGKHYDIYNGASVTLDYYGTSSACQRPGNTFNVIKNTAMNSNTCPAKPNPGEWINQPTYCGTASYTPARSVYRGTIKGNYDAVEADRDEILEGGIDEGEEDDYNYLTVNYDLALGDMIEYYNYAAKSDSANESDYYDSLATCLQNHKTFFGEYYYIGMLIHDGDFTTAQNKIDSIPVNHPSDSFALDFYEYADLTLGYYVTLSDTADTTGGVQWLKDNMTDVKNIADGSGSMYAAARAFTQIMAISDSINNPIDTFIYKPVILAIDTVEEDSIPDYEIAVTPYPNPFTDELDVLVTNNSTSVKRTFIVKLYDFYGNEVVTEYELKNVDYGSSATANFDTSGLDDGFYILRVLELGNEIYSTIVYKSSF